MKEDLALRALRALKDGGKTATRENLEALRSEVLEARDEYAKRSVELARELSSLIKTDADRSHLKAQFEEACSLDQGFHEMAGRISSILDSQESAA